MSLNDKLTEVLAAIDRVNEADPTQIAVEGHPQPSEVVYSRWLSEWVARLAPRASDPLRIAARGQHIARWTIPRSQYPMDRGGYLRWREDLKQFHAKKVLELMQAAGYGEPEQEATRQIILKKNREGNSEAQILEDALCLVFLQHQYEPFWQKTDEAKMIDILRKTWRKMSEPGRAEALKLSFSPGAKALLEKALQG